MSTQPKRSKKTTKRVESNPAPRSGSMSHVALRVTKERSDPGTAFLPDPYDRKRPPARAGDPLAESMAESYVASATSAEDVAEDERDEVQTEELGGPFTETNASEEFANEPDESNPVDAAREPFPTVTRLPS
jgi:hypothetical protein